MCNCHIFRPTELSIKEVEVYTKALSGFTVTSNSTPKKYMCIHNFYASQEHDETKFTVKYCQLAKYIPGGTSSLNEFILSKILLACSLNVYVLKYTEGS